MPDEYTNPERGETHPQPAIAVGSGRLPLSGDETLLGAGVPRKRKLRELARGELVGRYSILERIGAGGMGVVFSAYDPKLDRRIAIKLMVGAADDDPGSTRDSARLEREGQALAKLSHPNVVSIYDVGTLGDSVFIAMEFVSGKTLRQWREESEETEIAWQAIVGKYIAAGKGLAAAHDAGIVHRDFKPDNVMVGPPTAEFKVMDFGLARAAVVRGRTASQRMTPNRPPAR